MYKINYKAVLLVYVLQLLAGVIWYSAAPATVTQLLNRAGFMDLSIGDLVGFAIAVFVYAFFCAWCLVKTKLQSSSDMFWLLVGIWLFTVLPNIVFVNTFYSMTETNLVYLLSYGFVSCLIAAVILPFWRASRTIFKG